MAHIVEDTLPDIRNFIDPEMDGAGKSKDEQGRAEHTQTKRRREKKKRGGGRTGGKGRSSFLALKFLRKGINFALEPH